MTDETLLVLSGFDLPLYSTRGATQTLEPIDATKNVRRDINGDLQDLSYDQFRKLKTKISCSDQRAPGFDEQWPGSSVTVNCVAELRYAVSGDPARTPVSGSERTEGDFVYYRPVLEMLLVSFDQQVDEYGATVSWNAELEEV